MSNQQIRVEQDRILISGELSFVTVYAVLESSKKLFPPQGPWNCDLSQVSNCDSAGVALLVEWLQLAQQKKIKIRFLQLPQQLQTIIAATGLNQLFA